MPDICYKESVACTSFPYCNPYQDYALASVARQRTMHWLWELVVAQEGMQCLQVKEEVKLPAGTVLQCLTADLKFFDRLIGRPQS